MDLYLNDAQQYLLLMSPRDLIAVCGRGFGKGVIQAERVKNSFQMMPRSVGGFVAPSVKRALTNILPSLITHWERWGYKRDVHYTIGHAPARAWKWEKPYIPPQNWENTVSFYNGSVMQIISQDRSGTSNSLSLDWLNIDEAKFIDFEQLKNETFQANRGQEMFFGKCHLHHGMTVTSDMPLTKAGSWFLKYEHDMDPQLVRIIQGLVYRRWELEQRIKSGDGSHDYLTKELRFIEANLSQLRKRCLLYKEYTTIENLQVLGKQYIQQMKRDLPPLTFATSIMCRRIGIATDGFYGGMKESNKYTAPDVAYLDNMEYDFNKLGKQDSRMDADIDPNKPLVIAFDANANINWMVVGQLGENEKHRPVLRIVKSFYTKYERKIPELLDDFNEYFAYHRMRKLVFYYDSTFVGNNYALQNDDFHHYICSHLRRLAWQVKDKYIGNPMGHIEKQLLITRMFQGKARYQIFINKDNNEDLLVSIQSAGVYNGKKDKRGEKLAETEEDKLEGRTDGSDAFDTVCIGVEKFPVAQGRGGVASSFGAN